MSKKRGNPVVFSIMYILTWGAYGSRRVSNSEKSIRAVASLVVLFAALVLMSGCNKSQDDQAEPAPTNHAEKKGGNGNGNGGNGNNGNGNGGGSQTTPLTYITEYYDNIEVNLTFDTTNCGTLILKYDPMDPNILSYQIQPKSAHSSCAPNQSYSLDPTMAYITYGWGCNFDASNYYNDVEIRGQWGYIQNDTSFGFVYKSTPQEVYTGIGTWDCN